MKIVATKDNKQTVKISKKEWETIGQQAGWTKIAQYDSDSGLDIKQKIANDIILSIKLAVKNAIIQNMSSVAKTSWFQNALMKYRNNGKALNLTDDEDTDPENVLEGLIGEVQYYFNRIIREEVQFHVGDYVHSSEIAEIIKQQILGMK